MNDFVEYDEETKIWKPKRDPYDAISGQSIGEIFLKRMRSRYFTKRKVLETHHDVAVSKTEADIYRESVTVAINLMDLGIKKGDVVILYSTNNVTVTPLTMGCYMTGVAVNTFETKYEDADMIDYVLQLLDPTLIIYQEFYKLRIIAALERIKLAKLKHIFSMDGENNPPQCLHVQNALLRKVAPDEIEQFNCPDLGNPADLVGALPLTSGSTGKPKVAALNHTRLLQGVLVRWDDPRSPQLKANSESIVFCFSNLRWISQTISMLQSVLLGISRICFAQPPSGAYGRDIVRQHRVTHYFSIPEFYKAILNAMEPTDQSSLASLRVVFVGGEATPETTIELSKRYAVNCTVWRLYGMTELGTAISNDSVVNGGLLAPGVEMKILDDNGYALGPRQRGQLCVRVAAPFHYLNIDKEKTFLPDGFFNTGDYGFVDEQGLLNVLTRYSNLVRTMNSAIVPAEFESQVNQLEGVLSSALVGYGLVADFKPYDLAALFILLKPLQPGTSELEIRANIENTINSKLLSEIRLKKVYFMEELPKLPGGKIDQVALRKITKEGTLK